MKHKHKNKLIDPVGATKFVKALAGNAGIRVIYEKNLNTPYATFSGEIHLPMPTIADLDSWNYKIHHELSHAIPEHKYHFLAMAEAKQGQHVMNIILDNLAERHEFTKYEGRRKILSEGRLAFVTNELDLDSPSKSPEDELIKGLFSWDSKQRKSWMGWQYESINGLPDFPEMFKWFETIELERLMDAIELM